jgi:hypothetical protein
MKMIVKTKILCYSTSLQDVGVDSDAWFDAALDLSKVVAIRQTSDKEGDPITGEVKVYMVGGYDFIIQFDFQQFFNLWIKYTPLDLLNLQ